MIILKSNDNSCRCKSKNQRIEAHTPRFLLENGNILYRNYYIYKNRKYTLIANTFISILITIVKVFR